MSAEPSSPTLGNAPASLVLSGGGLWPGLLLATGLASAGYVLHRLTTGSLSVGSGVKWLDPVTLAIVLGLVTAAVWRPSAAFLAGIRFASKSVLGVGVVLLGARMDLVALLAVGGKGLALSVGVVGCALAFFLLFGSRLRLSRDQSILLGVGTGICGGTAIMAIAPIIRAKQEDTLMSVAAVTFLGMMAMFVLPVVANVLGLSAIDYGIWAGLTIHQTPQVIAAGFAYGPEAGQVATVVKLARVGLLAPVALLIILFGMTRATAGNAHTGAVRRALAHFPLFIVGFIGMATLRTLGLLPEVDLHWTRPLTTTPFELSVSLPAILSAAATFLLTVAMAATGLETDLRGLRRTCVKPLLAALTGSVLIGFGALVILQCLKS